MTHAVKAYEEKARDQWLFDYPAQVSLCGTQIWWTSDVRSLKPKFQRDFKNDAVYFIGWNSLWKIRRRI